MTRHRAPAPAAGAKTKPGSCDHAAEVAARAFLSAGATLLGVKLAAYVASFGGVNWQTDVTIQRSISRPDGRPYHVESIGRVRRELARRGWLRSIRISPGQRPHEKAKWSSTHGTTTKSIAWRELGVRNPLARGERRRARALQDRQAPTLTPRGAPRPRYSAPAPLTVPELPADLQRAVDRATQALELRWEREERASSSSSPSSSPSSSSGADPPD